jgi:hypothetical protein
VEQERTISHLARLNQGPNEVCRVPEGVLIARLVSQNYVGQTVLIRGVATRIARSEVTREFEIHFMDEQLFTPRGEMLGTIRVRPCCDQTGLPIKDIPTLSEGDVIFARDDWFTPTRTTGSARKRHGHFLRQLFVQLTRAIKEARPEDAVEP